VTFGISILYFIFAAGHSILDPPELRLILPLSDGGVSLFLIAFYGMIVRNIIPKSQANLVAALLTLVVLATDILNYALAPRVALALNFMLIQLGIGSLLLSFNWYLLLSIVILGSWVSSTALWGEMTPEWFNYSIVLLSAFILSAIILISRIRTLGELEISYLRFKRLSDAALEGIIFHREGTIVDVNQSAAQMFGYNQEELVGRNLDLIFEGSFLCKSPQNFQTEGRKKDGTTFPTEISCKPIIPGVQPTWTIAVRDLTARKRQEEVIRTQQNKMIHSAKMSALGEMAGGVSHEINNPLTAIMMQAEFAQNLIKERGMKSEETVEVLARIRSYGERIKTIIKGLLSFARDAENDPFERVHLSKLIQDTAVFCNEKFRQNRIRFEINPGPENLTIECKPVHLSQVILNLLNNAFDAVALRPEKYIKVAVQDLGTQVIISVLDNGKGVPQEVREKIMQPFFTTKGPREGTGLGLSISKGLMDAHHGTIELDSMMGQYTRFSIRLPKVQPKSEQNAS
jgi:PAS domain S-box-containing protein